MESKPVGTAGEGRLISSLENTRVPIGWGKETAGKRKGVVTGKTGVKGILKHYRAGKFP